MQSRLRHRGKWTAGGALALVASIAWIAGRGTANSNLDAAPSDQSSVLGAVTVHVPEGIATAAAVAPTVLPATTDTTIVDVASESAMASSGIEPRDRTAAVATPWRTGSVALAPADLVTAGMSAADAAELVAALGRFVGAAEMWRRVGHPVQMHARILVSLVPQLPQLIANGDVTVEAITTSRGEGAYDSTSWLDAVELTMGTKAGAFRITIPQRAVEPQLWSDYLSIHHPGSKYRKSARAR